MHSRRIVPVLVLGLACARAGAAEKVERKELVIVSATATIVVDGALGEWDRRNPVEVVLDPDEEGFRGTFRLAWDAEHLYVAAEVLDSSPMRNRGDDPVMAFKTGDTLELFLCTNPKADPRRRQPTTHDYRIAMTYLRNTRPVVVRYHPVSTRGEPRYVSHPTGSWRTRLDEAGPIAHAMFRVRRRPDGTGYTAEAKVPWKAFGGFKPRAGMRVPFNLAINFSDAAGRMNVAKVYWNGPNGICTDVPTELRLNPRAWGWATLRPAPRARPLRRAP